MAKFMRKLIQFAALCSKIDEKFVFLRTFFKTSCTMWILTNSCFHQIDFIFCRVLNHDNQLHLLNDN